MTQKFLAFGLVALSGVCCLNAQETPVIAKVSDKSETILNGKAIETVTREGIFFRASNGSELRRWLTMDGKPVNGDLARGSLLDKAHDTNYLLDYQKREAFIIRIPVHPLPTGAESDNEQSQSLPKSTVQGISCTLQPVSLVSPGTAAPTPIGQDCFSERYNLHLRMESTRAGPGGTAYHQVTQLYDLQLGTEPDPKLFDLSGFTVHSQ